MDTLVRIKRLVIARHVLFTQKAESEMAGESLTPELVYESILNAPAVFKSLRSRNPRTKKTEKLYVIKGLTFDGLDIYTKGKILSKEGVDIFYVLVSSKSFSTFIHGSSLRAAAAGRVPRGCGSSPRTSCREPPPCPAVWHLLPKTMVFSGVISKYSSSVFSPVILVELIDLLDVFLLECER